MIYYRDSGWHVCVNKVKNCTQASQHQCNIWRSNDGLFKWDNTGMASVKHKTQHATCNEPTIRPFQHPRQSRTLLQFRWVAGPNMAQTLPQHSHCSDKSDASNLVSPRHTSLRTKEDEVEKPRLSSSRTWEQLREKGRGGRSGSGPRVCSGGAKADADWSWNDEACVSSGRNEEDPSAGHTWS